MLRDFNIYPDNILFLVQSFKIYVVKNIDTQIYMYVYVWTLIQQTREVNVHYTFQSQLLKWQIGDSTTEDR